MKTAFASLSCLLLLVAGCGEPSGGQDATGDESAPDLRGCGPCIEEMCEFHWRCDDGHTYWSGEEYDDDCGCATGCHYSGRQECPEGTLCYAEYSLNLHGVYGYASSMPCRGNECNLDEGRSCPEGRFCDTLPGVCGGPGICNYGWGEYFVESGEMDWTYTCGCDGVTYAGMLKRLEAGASVAREGQCCVPERLGLDAPNAAGHTMWTACATKDALEGLPTDLSEMVADARYGEHGYTMGCADGDAIYMGDISLTVDGAVDPDQYDRLCRLASFPGFHNVGGHAADYCETACWTGLECGETDCPSICGCCPCETGKQRCIDTASHTTCASTGCWAIPVWCPDYAACVQDGDTVRCEPSCDVMLDKMLSFARPDSQMCNEYTKCRAVPGFCDRADGHCWVPWNGSNLFWDVKGFQEHWLAEGCWDQEACGCGDAPAADCVDGWCVLDY